MLPINRSNKAEDDLEEILIYLDERSPAAAQRVARSIHDRCAQLGSFPGMGRARNDLGEGIKSIVVEKYVIFYRSTETAVEIVRILHGARDVDRIMKAEPPG